MMETKTNFICSQWCVKRTDPSLRVVARQSDRAIKFISLYQWAKSGLPNALACPTSQGIL